MLPKDTIAHRLSQAGSPSQKLLVRMTKSSRQPRLAARPLGAMNGAETSAIVRCRVDEARKAQRHRYAGEPSVRCNAQASGRPLLRALTLDARDLLDGAAESLALSARAYHRVVKVARTIADLAHQEHMAASHVAEALRYRPR